MLPVQTVMIRYMVLVYRWGRGWLSVVGDWEGFAGGDVTGGCARRRGLPLPDPGAKRPRRRGAGGAFLIIYRAGWLIRSYFLEPRQIHLEALQAR